MPLATPPIPKQDDPAVDFLRESVTAGDVVSKVENNVIHVMIPFGGEGAGWGQWGIDQIQLPPNPPPYWTFDRDYTLRSTVHKESFWAGAIGIAISKIAAMGFEIKGDVPLRVKRGQEILLYADGRQTGYVNFISKHLRDYLTTDNGAFFEIVRDGNSYMSKVLGIRHLDSTRCIRTGDPIIPIVYRDRRNVYHELKFYEVVCIADMPNPGETFNGTGLCAASRAYFSIYKLASIEWYLREKVGGLQPLAIHVVNGILDQQLKDAIQAAKEGALARGVIAHMGAVLIGVPSDQQPALVTIPLAELPDGFNRREEFDLSILAYANAIGLDPQDLQPLTGAPLGSGMQTEILHEKSKGRGLAGWRPQFVHQINEFVLSQGTTFTFYDKDFRDLQAQANLSKALADTSAARITAGITTPQQELQVLVDKDELPKEFLNTDLTAGETLSDTEKPEEAKPDTLPAAENPPAQPPAPPAPKQAEPETAQTAKEFDYEAFKDELNGAQDIFDMIEAGFTTLKDLTRHIKRDENGQFASYGGGKALPRGEGDSAPSDRRGPKQVDAAGRVKTDAPGNAPGGASADDREQDEQEDGKGKRREKHGKTLKHLAGKHDQKRHAWRYGPNVPLSKLKRQKKTGGDSEWEEYKKRARAKRGTAPAKSKQPAKQAKSSQEKYFEAVNELWEENYHKFPDGSMEEFDKIVTNDPAWKKWNDNLSDGEREAIKAYTDGAYGSMNKALRDNKVNSDFNKFNGYTQKVNDMSTALARGETTENIQLYRGFSSGYTANLIQNGQLHKDGIFNDKGFMSCSTSSSFSSSWGGGANKIFLNIKAPKGTKGAFMAFGLGHAGISHEQEFVFPPGTSFHIKDIRFENGTYYLDLIPAEAVINVAQSK